MAQRNIDFGEFPDDPNADAIRTAFKKVQENFSELFSGLQEQAVLSVNRTQGAGISVNSPTGNVVVTANIACVQVSTSTLSIGRGTNGSPYTSITQSSQVLVVDLPSTISNVTNANLSGYVLANYVNANISLNSTGNITANNGIISNLLSVGANANVTGNINITANANITANLNANNGIISNLLSVGANANVTGNLNVTANANIIANLKSGNADLGNLAVANFFSGNGSLLTGVIAVAGPTISNGTSNINIPATNGNVVVGVGGTANVANFTTTGMNVVGTGNFTGNVIAGNLIGPLANGNSNVSIPAAAGNVSVYTNGTIRANFTVTGANISGTFNATGNANVGNIGAAAGVFTTVAGSLTTASQPDITSLGTLSALAVTGNASAGNLNTAGAVVASTLTSNIATGTAPLIITSTTRVNNLNVAYSNVADFMNVTAPGTGTGYVVFANATSGNVAEWISSGITSNLANNSITATTFVGALSGTATSATNAAAVQSNTSTSTTAYLLGTGTAANGNVSLSKVTGIYANMGNNAITATTFVGALSGAATTAGTVTTNEQPNITSVGTLTSLDITGNITSGNIDGGNLVKGNFVQGTLITAAQLNITSVGTLSTVAVTGNASAGNLNTAGAVVASTLTSNVATGTAPLTVTSTTRVANLNVAYANVTDLINVTAPGTGIGYIVLANAASGNVAELVSVGISSNLANNSITATTFVGALSGAATSATNAAAVLSNTSAATTVYLLGTGTAANGNVSLSKVTGIYANMSNNAITATTFVGALSGAATTAGTVTTNAQPNITSVGTLSALTVTGNITAGNIDGGNLVKGNYFQGDGGLLSNISVSAGTSIINGTSNVVVDPSGLVRVSVSSSPNVLSVSSTGANIAGTLNATGNANVGNIGATNLVGTVVGQISSSSSSQPNITSLGTLTGLTVNGIANLSAVGNVRISGGSNNQVLVATGTGSNVAFITATSLTVAPGANTQVLFNDAGSFAANANMTFDKTTGNLSIGGNLSVTNNIVLSTSNITGVNVLSATTLTGTLTAGPQTGINALGTLTALTVTGTISANNVNTTNNANAKVVNAVTGTLTGSNSAINVTQTWNNAAATFTSILENITDTASAANSLLIDLQVATASKFAVNKTGNIYFSGGAFGDGGGLSNIAGANVSGAVSFATTANAVAGANVSGTVSSATNAAAVLQNTSTSTTVYPTFSTSSANGNSSAVFNIGIRANLSNASITATTFVGNVSATTLAGNLTTAAQPNITSVGTLTSLSVTTQGTFGSQLSAQGSATVNSQGAWIGWNQSVGNGETNFINQQGSGDIGGFTWQNSTTLNARTTIATLTAAGAFSATANITAPRLISNVATGTAPLVVTSTTQVANLNAATAGTAGTVTTAAQPAITSVGTLSALEVTANANVGNLRSSGIVYANNNLIVGSTSTEGAQIILGYAGINNFSGQTSSTWNMDVDSSNSFRIFNVNATGVASTPIYFYSANSNVSFPGSLLVTSAITAATLSVTGNANVGNLGTARVLATANVTAPQLISNVATGTAPLVVTSTTQVANLNVATAGTVTTAAQPAITSVGTLTTLNMTGGITSTATNAGIEWGNPSSVNTPFIDFHSSGNSSIDYDVRLIASGGNLGGLNGTGTLTIYADNTTVIGNISSSYFIGNGNSLSSIVGANVTGAVSFATTANAVAGANVSGTVSSATAATNASALLQNTSVATTVYPTFSTSSANGNSSAVISTGISANLGNASITATTFVGALSGAATSATTAGTVVTAAQPNITSVGTLTSLGVNGTVTAVAFTANTGVFTGNGNGLSSIVGANVTGAVSFATTANAVAGANVSGTVSSATNAAAVQSNTSTTTTVYLLGTGTAANGNVSLSKVTGIYANMGNNAITATTFVGALSGAATSATTAGTVTTAAQTSITSVGTLTGLTLAANADITMSGTGSNINGVALVSATLFAGSGANLTALNGSNISSGTLAQARLANSNVILGSTALTLGSTVTTVAGLTSVTSTTFVGALTGAATTAATVTTAAQPTITSVGTLTSILVSGNARVESFGVGTAASGTAGEIRATNNITAYFSDDRLKNRINNITDALEKVLSLNGFYYEPNEVAESLGYAKHLEVGVSAQEVQKVLPEVVVPAPIDDKYLTVRYEKIIPLLIEAIKEQQAHINIIEQKLNQLSNQEKEI